MTDNRLLMHFDHRSQCFRALTRYEVPIDLAYRPLGDSHPLGAMALSAL